MDIVAEGIASAAGTAGSGQQVAEHLFRSMGVDGVYARTGIYEEVIGGLNAFISRHRPPATEVMRFPPVMSRDILERSGYLKSFPNLLGCVCALDGTEADIRAAADRYGVGGDWTTSLVAADLVLTPAACYPVYPIAAARGVVPGGGLLFDVACDCFRREPSRKLDRLQSFRMREYVCIGSDEEVTAFRTRWIERGEAMAAELQLPCSIEPANDPFFGRAGQVMGISQRQQALKFELLVPLYSPGTPTACMSFNYHRDHFGKVWGLQDSSGNLSHTGCAAFGLDRLAVALFWTHGHRVADWPEGVRRALHLRADGEGMG